MSTETVRFALMLSTAAGMATVLGGLAAVCLDPSRRVLAGTLGFAAGVMATVSLAELLPESAAAALPLLGSRRGTAAVLTALLCGTAVSHGMGRLSDALSGQNGLRRLGILSAAALLLHNLPEGMAVFAGTAADRTLGLSLAAAIALHNLPEGLSVSMPIYAATGNRKSAVALAALSGAAEPVGAWLTWRLLDGTIQPLGSALLFAGAAGLMICLAAGELFPQGMRQDARFAAVGAVLGATVMLLSLRIV